MPLAEENLSLATKVKNHLELPIKLGTAFTVTEILGHFLPGIPNNYDDMLSLTNIGSTELKVLTNSIIMSIPQWDRLFRDQNHSASFFDLMKAFASNTSKGVFAFSIQSLMGTVIRFSLPPQWQLEFFLHVVNGYMTATVLDHLLEKKIPILPFIQVIAMLAFKQSSSTINAALLPLLTSSLDIDEDVLTVLTHILTDVILPPVAGVVTSAGVQAATSLGKSMKEGVSLFWNRGKSAASDNENNRLINEEPGDIRSMTNFSGLV